MLFTRMRCLMMATSLIAATIGVALWLIAQTPPVPSHRTEFSAALPWLLAWTGVLALVGLLGSGLRGVLDAWNGLPVPGSGGIRRWMVLACGAGLGTALSAPALAVPPHSPHPLPPVSGHALVTSWADSLSGLPLPDRPVTPPRQPPEDRITVRPGDSLWRIAASRYPGAGPTRLLARVERLYRLNRAVIGPDPSLLHPGQSLRARAIGHPRER